MKRYIRADGKTHRKFRVHVLSVEEVRELNDDFDRRWESKFGSTDEYHHHYSSEEFDKFMEEVLKLR